MLREVYLITAIAVIALTSTSCGDYERPTAHYPTWQEVVKNGAITRGWIPSFLPNSSTNISERHDLDTNAGAFCFFAPTSDLELLVSQLERVPASRFHAVVPSISGSHTWWQPALAKGRLSELVKNDGFEVCQKVGSTSQPGGVEVWYFAINASKGIGYGWHKGN